MTGQEIKSLDSWPCSSGNLTKNEKTALKNLSNNYDITIKPSDKGGNVALIDNDQYSLMCSKILSNRDWYHPVSLELLRF